MSATLRSVDVAVVGAGHNGLVAAATCARAGLSVAVFEEKSEVGGAARTERPFRKAPEVGQSTGAYLLGLMPPELLAELDLDLPVLRRDPHYFLPALDGRYLLFGSDRRATEQQMRERFSSKDWLADERLHAELGSLREDVAPTWLEEPLTIEETADRYIRGDLKRTFVDLCRGSVGDYLTRFGFESELLPAMYAVTDGFTGCDGGWDTPGTGMNFLIHNMCRLPGADGTWMIVRGGMGTVAEALRRAAGLAGVTVRTDVAVQKVELTGGVVSGVALSDGTTCGAKAVMLACDPFRGAALVGNETLDERFRRKLEAWEHDGTTLKLNLCLRDLPRFSCLPKSEGQHRATIHLLPPEGEVLTTLRSAYRDVSSGRLAEFPSIEWYIHSTVDPSLSDDHGRHSAALFVQWAPYALADSSWNEEEDRYAQHLLSICDRFAPGTSELVEDMFMLTPPGIEEHFGIHRGHIHHVDNRFGFSDRVPYRWPLDGLYAGGAGCHPGGSVIGVSGRNAARALLRDFGRT